jgi:hypothetical protein
MKAGISTAMVLLLLGATSVLAADPDSIDEPTPNEGKQEIRSAVYVPPLRGRPRARVGGGVRGVRDAAPVFYTLVPDHNGQTVSAQPSLFWYLGGELSGTPSFVFTLIDDDHIDPLVEAKLPKPSQTGIQRIDLSRHGVHLESGTEYEWSVALVGDAARRSKDVMAVGWIDRVEPPAALGTNPGARAFAAQGLWYDAFAAAVDDAALRDALLRDAGLDPVPPLRRD